MAVKSLFNRMKFWKRTIDQGDRNSSACSPEYRLANKLRRYEKYFSQVQSIVMWDNPTLSVLCIILVNILFWIFASLEWRFYGIISSAMLVATVHEAWTGQIWPEISVPSTTAPPEDTPAHPSVVAMSKLLTTSCAMSKQCLEWLRDLRMRQPGLFCCMSSLVCSCLLLLGRHVSGLLLVYALLMSALIGPRLVTKCVPPELRNTVASYAACVRQTFIKYSSDANDEDYMPVTTSEDIALLTRASDLHHDTYDSLTNPGSSSDMASGLGLMPSHEEDSLGTLSDLEPPMLPLDHADDSDSNPADHQIEFQSGHFNGDSSSDEEAFARDLVFSETDERDAAVAATRGLSNLIAQAVASNVLGSVNMLANVMRPRQATSDDHSRQRNNRRSDDSDMDDFEIINRDELNNPEVS